MTERMVYVTRRVPQTEVVFLVDESALDEFLAELRAVDGPNLIRVSVQQPIWCSAGGAHLAEHLARGPKIGVRDV